MPARDTVCVGRGWHQRSARLGFQPPPVCSSLSPAAALPFGFGCGCLPYCLLAECGGPRRRAAKMVRSAASPVRYPVYLTVPTSSNVTGRSTNTTLSIRNPGNRPGQFNTFPPSRGDIQHGALEYGGNSREKKEKKRSLIKLCYVYI
jgi:hypothetical protein